MKRTHDQVSSSAAASSSSIVSVKPAAVVEQHLSEAVAYIQGKVGQFKPLVALILGSGLGDLADQVSEQRTVIQYAEVPHFRTSDVAGHKNQLVCGLLAGVPVVVQQGRFHFYEGYPISDLVFPLRVMKSLGAETLVVTNAAGGVNADFSVGDIMLITDHVNGMGANPLIGPNIGSLGPRFCDMSYAYTPALQKLAIDSAKALSLTLRQGTYFAMSGPSYETPAEIRMVRVLGGDAVGMSTVPEVIAASHMSMKVVGFSCITNMASGILDQPLDHAEVIETTKRVKEQFQKLVLTLLPKLK